MKLLQFPYKQYPVTPTKSIYRPVVPMRLKRGSNTLEHDALIDSGADQTTFPGWVAEELGFDVERGAKKIFSGIGGSVLTYLHRTQIELDGIKFVLDVHYSHQWDDMPFGLLGQDGFFSRFQGIAFDYKRKIVTLNY